MLKVDQIKSDSSLLCHPWETSVNDRNVSVKLEGNEDREKEIFDSIPPRKFTYAIW